MPIYTRGVHCNLSSREDLTKKGHILWMNAHRVHEMPISSTPTEKN